MMDDTLSKKVVSSGFWVLSLRIFEKFLYIVKLIILARILSPNDFGLMGIALLTLSILETFTNIGFMEALIQKNRDIEEYLDTAWTLVVIRGGIIFAVLFFIAPVAAGFFNSPIATPIIRIIAVSLLIKSLSNIGVVYFQKDLHFKKQVLLDLTGAIAYFVVAIVLGVLLRSVWALVFGQIASSIVKTVFSYILHPYRAKFQLNKDKISKLLNYGKWLWGSGVLVLLITQGDDLFLSKYLGIIALGFYQMAYKISNIPATEIAHVISQVTFPAYSKMQNDLVKLKEAYLKVLQLNCFFSFLISGLIFVLARDFTNIFLGSKWLPAVPPMMVLVIWGVIRSVGATQGPVFNAIGRPKILTIMLAIAFIPLLLLIYPLTLKWGMLGTSLSVVLATFLSTLTASIVLINLIRCEVYRFVKMLLFPFIAIVIVALLLFGLKESIFIRVRLFEFIVLSFVGIITYLGIIHIFDRYFNYGIYTVVKERLFFSWMKK